MKPIIRWTIGNVKPNGFKCLSYSINKLQGLYGDRFDYCLFYNNANPTINAKINMIKQESKTAKNTAWKLYPPRLNMDVPEIFIDNDLVLFNRLKQFDDLIEYGTPFMTAGLNRNFGKYNSLVGRQYILNSGLFGLPAGFDFRSKINATKNDWHNYYDEQGLVAFIMTSFNNLSIIPRSTIGICRPKDGLPYSSSGFHFCGLNHADKHYGWDKFIRSRKGAIKID